LAADNFHPSADVALRASVEGFSQRRIDLVNHAVRSWVRALFDLGGRNNLLRYRDLKAGTVDLTRADPGAIATLLRGREVRATSLFDQDQHGDFMRRLRAIHRKNKENFEERGIET
jgi:hypothetical protein